MSKSLKISPQNNPCAGQERIHMPYAATKAHTGMRSDQLTESLENRIEKKRIEYCIEYINYLRRFWPDWTDG